MKKIIIALLLMFVGMSSSFAIEQAPPKKGYNYAKNHRINKRFNKKQMHTFNNTGGHVCSGHRYKRNQFGTFKRVKSRRR